MSMPYIAGIDGLRAVAVLSVVLFHARVPGFSGGFLGVDVFFVISGYLISRNLITEITHDTFSYAHFLKRRISRLAPAALFWIFSSTAIFSAVFPPAFREDLLASALTALASVSNLWFYETVDYFGDVSSNPLLHTWSLAVEEQFYLIFPAALLVVARTGLLPRLGGILSALLILSISLSTYQLSTDPSASFYFVWNRAWELLAGVLLARHQSEVLKRTLPPFSLPIGLSGIIACILLTKEGGKFPGIYALPVVLLTVLTIASLTSPARHDSFPASLANRLLHASVSKWVGKISYSLYLAHWPVSCLVDRFLSLNGLRAQALCVVLSILLGWLSWRYIENPNRIKLSKKSNSKTYRAFACSSVAAAALCTAVVLSGDALWGRVSSDVHRTSTKDEKRAIFDAGGCFSTARNYNSRPNLEPSCVRAASGGKVILIVGDSHAANIAPALKSYLAPQATILQATAAGCYPLLHLSQAPHCRPALEPLEDSFWKRFSPGTAVMVLLAARWESDQESALLEAITAFRRHGAAVVVLGRWPEYYMPVPLATTYSHLLSINLLPYLVKADVARVERHLSTSKRLSEYYVSVYDVLATAHLDPLANRPLVYFDKDHLTRVGAQLVAERAKSAYQIQNFLAVPPPR